MQFCNVSVTSLKQVNPTLFCAPHLLSGFKLFNLGIKFLQKYKILFFAGCYLFFVLTGIFLAFSSFFPSFLALLRPSPSSDLHSSPFPTSHVTGGVVFMWLPFVEHPDYGNSTALLESHWGYDQAFYWSWTTFTTCGYGDLVQVRSLQIFLGANLSIVLFDREIPSNVVVYDRHRIFWIHHLLIRRFFLKSALIGCSTLDTPYGVRPFVSSC